MTPAIASARRATLPRVTPLAVLIRRARLAATPTPAEIQARTGRSGPVPATGLSHAELAARCNAVLEGRGERPTVHRESLVRVERTGPREPLLAIICDALGLDVHLLPAPAPSRIRTARRSSR